MIQQLDYLLPKAEELALKKVHILPRRRRKVQNILLKKLGKAPTDKSTGKTNWITKKSFPTHGKDVPTMASKGGRIGAKAGGDGKWIQKVNASIKRRGTKGKCTPITKPGCTGTS